MELLNLAIKELIFSIRFVKERQKTKITNLVLWTELKLVYNSSPFHDSAVRIKTDTISKKRKAWDVIWVTVLIVTITHYIVKY